MSPAFVIDASMAMAWCFADEATDATEELQERLETESGLVPAHWCLEVANALAIAERRQRIEPARSDEFINSLAAFTIEFDKASPRRIFSHILPLARTHRLSIYDTVYLDLALRRRLPLASLDNELRAAAESHGIQVLGK